MGSSVDEPSNKTIAAALLLFRFNWVVLVYIACRMTILILNDNLQIKNLCHCIALVKFETIAWLW